MVLYSYLSDLITLKVINVSIIILSAIFFLVLLRSKHMKPSAITAIEPEDVGGGGSNRLEKKLDEISEAYGVESLTITTRDGFVVLSSSPTGEFDAANFSSLFASMAEECVTRREATPLATESGVAWVAPLDSAGMDETLCVIRSEAGIKEKTALKIKDETEKIMENLFTAS